MKFRNIAVGIVVGGVIFAGGVAAVAWQKGWSIRETVELGAGVIASKTSRHTIADRTAAILGLQERAIRRSPRTWLESSAHLSDDGLQRDARSEAARGRRANTGGHLRDWIPKPEFELLSFAQGDISERVGQGARESGRAHESRRRHHDPRQGGYNRVRACRRRRDRRHLLSRVGGGDKERLGRHRAIRHAQRPQAGTGTFAAQVVS